MLKKILVTGSNGFIGKELIKNISNFEIITDYQNDIRINLLSTQDIMKIEPADIVIHLAGKTPQKKLDDLDFLKNNLLTTINILDYCIKKNIKKLIYVSSYVYGIPNYNPINENHPIHPHNGYTESKYLGESICKFISEKSKLKITILRPFNIYGDDMNEGYFLTNLLNCAKTDERIIISNKNSRRDFLHVNDFIDLILQCINLENNFEIFNAGSGQSFSLEEIITIIERALDKKLNIEYVDEPMNELSRVEADINKIKNVLTWRPKRNFENELLKMLDKKL